MYIRHSRVYYRMCLLMLLSMSLLLQTILQKKKKDGWFMVFKATFNNISAITRQSVLLVKEIGVRGENHRPVASHGQTLSHTLY